MNKKHLKTTLGKVLLPFGYTCMKDMYFRQINDVFLLVDLQKSSFGGTFFINIGIFVNEGDGFAQPPTFQDAHIQQSLLWIVPQNIGIKLASALNLEMPMADEERSGVITTAVEEYGMPYLNSLSTIEGIANYLDPDKKNFAGVTVAIREIIGRRTGRDFSI